MKAIHKTRVSTKGQITIPKVFRDKLKVNVGDKVTLIMIDNGILIKPDIARIGTLRGLLKDEIDITKATEFIDNERKKWRL
ncbi:MAG TPA: AbrB/MazE/SpoVT family DNA-binding domain-containing protein [Candidatus Lokiarchaeia archaeon]|nr:AbrB/MazE/SpoVT family DNA-binding domain-containing protein [Candidatus Lokiarchaeia archaeon]